MFQRCCCWYCCYNCNQQLFPPPCLHSLCMSRNRRGKNMPTSDLLMSNLSSTSMSLLRFIEAKFTCCRWLLAASFKLLRYNLLIPKLWVNLKRIRQQMQLLLRLGSASVSLLLASMSLSWLVGRSACQNLPWLDTEAPNSFLFEHETN